LDEKKEVSHEKFPTHQIPVRQASAGDGGQGSNGYAGQTSTDDTYSAPAIGQASTGNFVRSPQARSVKPPQANSVKPPQFAGQKRVVLAGSEKSAAPNSVRLKATPPKSKVTVSVIVKRKEPLKINQRGGRANGPARVSRAWFKKHHSADPSAMTQIKAFAKEISPEGRG